MLLVYDARLCVVELIRQGIVIYYTASVVYEEYPSYLTLLICPYTY